MENQINSIVFGDYGDYGHNAEEFLAKQEKEKEIEEEVDVMKNDMIATDAPELETTEEPTTTTEEPTTTTTDEPTTTTVEPATEKPTTRKNLIAPEPAVQEEIYWDEDVNQGSWLLRFVAFICICAVVFCFYLYARRQRSLSASGAFFMPPKIPKSADFSSSRRLLHAESDDDYVIATNQIRKI